MADSVRHIRLDILSCILSKRERLVIGIDINTTTARVGHLLVMLPLVLMVALRTSQSLDRCFIRFRVWRSALMLSSYSFFGRPLYLPLTSKDNILCCQRVSSILFTCQKHPSLPCFRITSKEGMLRCSLRLAMRLLSVIFQEQMNLTMVTSLLTSHQQSQPKFSWHKASLLKD